MSHTWGVPEVYRGVIGVYYVVYWGWGLAAAGVRWVSMLGGIYEI